MSLSWLIVFCSLAANLCSSLCTLTMIINNNFVQKTYYDILGLQEDASQEEIRSAYRSAILGRHPDKILKESEHKSGKSFIDIQEAWENLGDPHLRSTYDHKLQTMRVKSLMSEDVNFEDLSVEEDGDRVVFSYSCRCGDYFTIDSVELTEIGYSFSKTGNVVTLHELASTSSNSSIVIPCGSCSLKIRLIIKTGVVVNIDNDL